MCGDEPQNTKIADLMPAQQPHNQLSDLIERSTGHRIGSTVLRLFLVAYWKDVAKLAHEIHRDA